MVPEESSLSPTQEEGTCEGLKFVFQKDAQVLIPCKCECDLIWKYGFYI